MAEAEAKALEFAPGIESELWAKNFPQNEAMLKKCKEKLGNALSDATLKAFILAWCEEEGEQGVLTRLENAIQWRKDKNFPEILGKPINDETLYAKVPFSIYHLSKNGAPVYYIDCPTSKIDTKECKEATKDISDRALMHLREIQELVGKKAGRPDSQFVSIIVLNMNGVGLLAAKDMIAVVQHMIEMGNDMFGINMHKCFLINCGWSIRMILALVLMMVHEVSKKKIVQCGSDFLPELTKFVPIERIPKKYGGTCEDEIVNCSILMPKELEYPHKRF